VAGILGTVVFLLYVQQGDQVSSGSPQLHPEVLLFPHEIQACHFYYLGAIKNISLH
jgi:hypothetical protein